MVLRLELDGIAAGKMAAEMSLSCGIKIAIVVDPDFRDDETRLPSPTRRFPIFTLLAFVCFSFCLRRIRQQEIADFPARTNGAGFCGFPFGGGKHFRHASKTAMGKPTTASIPNRSRRYPQKRSLPISTFCFLLSALAQTVCRRNLGCTRPRASGSVRRPRSFFPSKSPNLHASLLDEAIPRPAPRSQSTASLPSSLTSTRLSVRHRQNPKLTV